MEHPEQACLVPDVDLATVAYMLLEKQRDICYVSIEVANLMHECTKKLKTKMYYYLQIKHLTFKRTYYTVFQNLKINDTF